jgi:hypothetical protein
VHDSYEQLNVINTDELLYCSYITSNTIQFPFAHVSVCVWLDIDVWCDGWVRVLTFLEDIQ